nr:putative ribonuclease h protein [Quercus suber]
MDAPECSSGLYAWRSILQDREVLKQGARWRVGQGDSIKIWDTPWLPSLNHPRILSPILEGMQEAKVDTLIDQQSRSWDIDILKGFFAPLEVDLILKIPLSSSYVEDKLVWPHTANGVYSIKSGYNFLAKEKLSPSLALSHQDDGRSIWKKLWSLSMPNKIKNFLWRVSTEVILVKKNLVACKVLAEDVCDHCHVATEDVHHALWDCQELSAMWEADSMWLFRRTKKFSNFFELVSHVLEEKINLDLFATLVWTIWSRRNMLRTSTKSFPLSQVAPSASLTLQTFT